MICGYLVLFSIVPDAGALVVWSRGAAWGCVALLPACPVDLHCPGGCVVKCPGEVACPSGRRCSTRNAVWCHSHPGFKSQRYRHRRPAPLGPGGFVMPTWRVGGLLPRQISGRRAACPPARRPRRELRSARRLVVRPGPAGLAAPSNRSGCLCVARPGPATRGHRSLALRSLRRPPHRRGLSLCVAWPGPATRGHRSLALRSLRRPPHRRCLGFLWLRVPVCG